jgi:hypothetical protein
MPDILEDFVKKAAVERIREATAQFLRLVSDSAEDAEAMVRLAWSDGDLLTDLFGLVFPFGWRSNCGVVSGVTERLEFIVHFVSYYLHDDGYPGLCRHVAPQEHDDDYTVRVLIPWESGEGDPLIHPCKEVLEIALGVKCLPVLTPAMVVQALDATLKRRQERYECLEELELEEDEDKVSIDSDTVVLREWLSAQGLTVKLPEFYKVEEVVRP